eukprot:6075290-Pyramimonas_sp.AAC.1
MLIVWCVCWRARAGGLEADAAARFPSHACRQWSGSANSRSLERRGGPRHACFLDVQPPIEQQ